MRRRLLVAVLLVPSVVLLGLGIRQHVRQQQQLAELSQERDGLRSELEVYYRINGELHRQLEGFSEHLVDDLHRNCQP